METPRGQVTCQSSHSLKVAEPEPKPSLASEYILLIASMNWFSCIQSPLKIRNMSIYFVHEHLLMYINPSTSEYLISQPHDCLASATVGQV